MKFDLRMSGLGGQGMVTAANILGMATVKDGNYSIVIPFFGAEKRLAPTESYTRISSEPVYEKGEVNYPNIIMIFHEEVITQGKCYTMPFYEGLQENGIIIINSPYELPIPKHDLEAIEKLNARIIYIPAAKIALEVAGTELATNMAMLGVLIGLTNIVSFESLESSISERFGKRKFIASGSTAALDDVIKKKYAKVQDLIDKNMQSVRVAAKEIKRMEDERCRSQ
ncbi:MAG: 2-oxoacid:acceptor oxidoreductase family protein [Methanosarcinaceae archaeon]|jgi:pyruvate ferredoxin oxidoreductase gamma subunit|nr:2-oxoacid:acceptor oxidoreductase family protein [Methanosarcinaceae archaeon]